MGRPSSGGGGGGSALFTSNVSGPPPGPLTCPGVAWIDLGLIPVGQFIRFGSAQYASPGKSITFEVRTNLAGQSAATTGATLLLASSVASVRSGQITVDYYKSNTLNIKTVIGTGVEHAWLRLSSKTLTATDYFFSINYLVA